MFHVPEEYRIKTGRAASTAYFGNNGAFELPPIRSKRKFFCIVSDGGGWEHVSIHMSDGKFLFTPDWAEMCHIKDLFWDKEDVVVQYHPRESEYVNNHPNVLHLWRPTAETIPTPPVEFVGVKVKS